MKKSLISLLATSVLTVLSTANASLTDLGFYKSGVYAPTGIRIYDSENKEITSNILEPGRYTFKTQIKNFGEETSSSQIEGIINGPENHSWTITPIESLNPNLSIYRQNTRELTTPGEYVFKSKLNLNDGNISNNIAERQFTIIHEPSSIFPFLIIPGYFLARKIKYKSLLI